MTVFTVERGAAQQRPATPPMPPNHQSFDVATLVFDDAGALTNPATLAALVSHVEGARRACPQGVLVAVFVHGWHHGPAWDDTHFVAFRELLMGLTLREAERYGAGPCGRRVIGVYVGWNGDPSSWIGPTETSFWDRLAVAGAVGDGALRYALRELVRATKDPAVADAPHESPFVLVGHSMGALVVESAFLSLLTDADRPLAFDLPSDAPPRPIETMWNGQRVAFPDVVLALNSAADSQLYRDVDAALAANHVTKRAVGRKHGYDAPVIVSATSVADAATGKIWRLARPGRSTDGHDTSLHTHTFSVIARDVSRPPRGNVSFGQAWHGILEPAPSQAPPGVPPVFEIDLPAADFRHDAPSHDRYRLAPRPGVSRSGGWVFHVPDDLVADHNDIFNQRAGSLVLALLQLSGAVASLAADFDDTFER
jgi:hypothetical protein